MELTNGCEMQKPRDLHTETRLSSANPEPMPRMRNAPVPPLCVSLAPPKQKLIPIGGFTSEKTEGSFMFPGFLVDLY